MKPFDKCPVCSGELIEKKVEKLIKGGKHTAAVEVNACVCLKCGERLYTKDVIDSFENIRNKLLKNDTNEFFPIGNSYQVYL